MGTADPRHDQGWTDNDGVFLYFLVAEDALMTDIENNLRDTGQIEALARLTKFMQDVGIEMIGGPSHDLSGFDADTAALHRNFEPVTAGRLRCLHDIHGLLTDVRIKEKLQNLLLQCPAPPSAAAAPAHRTYDL